MPAITNTGDITSTDRVAVGNQPDQTPPTGGTAASGGGSGGAGLPTGGAKYQYLAKTSASNYAAGWLTPDTFNVVTYGADPTGSASSLTAINAALAAATSGGVIYFPPGSYKITGTITIPQQNPTFVIKGAGARASWLQPNGNFDLFSGGYSGAKNFTVEDIGCIYGSQQTTTSFVKWTAGNGLYLNRLLVYNCGHFLTLGTDQVGAAFNYAWVTGCSVQSQGGILWNLIGSMGAIYLRDNYSITAQSGTQILAHTGTHTPVIDAFWCESSDFEGYAKGVLFEYSADGGVVDGYFHNVIVGNGITGSHAISVKPNTSTAGRCGNLVFDGVNANCGGASHNALNLDNAGTGYGVRGVWVRGCTLGASSGDGLYVGKADEVWVKDSNFNSSTNGIHVGASAGFVDIVANRVGLAGYGNSVGILLDSGAAGGIVTSNDVRSNTTALTNNWGANSVGVRYVANNFGVDV